MSTIETSDMINKQGFPIETCSRCLGTGHYSYNLKDGTICYGCLGNGTQVTKPARQAWSLYLAELQRRKEPTVQNLEIGDIVSHNKIWRQVTSVEITPEVVASQLTGHDDNGDEIWKPLAYKAVITLAKVDKGDKQMPEETVSVTSNQVVRRHSGKIDPTPFLAMIESK
jgi:hypothetical protein